MLKSAIDTQRNRSSKSDGMEETSSPDCHKARYRPAQSTIERLRRVEAAERARRKYLRHVCRKGVRQKTYQPRTALQDILRHFSGQDCEVDNKGCVCRRHYAAFFRFRPSSKETSA